jgi:hypothetical protein
MTVSVAARVYSAFICHNCGALLRAIDADFPARHFPRESDPAS